MKNKIIFPALLMLSVSMFFLYRCKKDEIQPFAPQTEMKTNGEEKIQGKYIVVFKENEFTDLEYITEYGKRNAKMFDEVSTFLKKNNIPDVIAERVYHTAIKGFSARLNSLQLDVLKTIPEVSFIEEDKIVSLGPVTGDEPIIQSSQSIPYGITRVGWVTAIDGSGKVAWIIDTGIDLTHPDLNVDVTRSKSFLFSGKNFKSPNDENGHGTHVSGTVAAKNNTIGVVGVAPNASLVSVRVLNQSGTGTLSGVISGVDYVATKGKAGDAANMSLGGGISTSLDNAVYNASQKGIFFAIAAGNSSANANNYSPARVNGTFIYTVSAMDSTDTWAYFSNFSNPPVDFCEPGVNVLSTWKGGKYKAISGTSMAAPHVAGILLITNGSPNNSGTVKNDPDGNPDPIAHL